MLLPPRVKDDATYTIRTLQSLGADSAETVGFRYETSEIQRWIDPKFAQIDAHGTASTRNLLAGIADGVRRRSGGVDTVAVEIQVGRQVFRHVLTNIEGQVYIFDSSINRDTPRIRPYEEWTPLPAEGKILDRKDQSGIHIQTAPLAFTRSDPSAPFALTALVTLGGGS